MLAQIALINKARNERKQQGKEKNEKATPKHKLYNFTLSPYFMKKETGIPISNHDAKAAF